MEPNPKPAEVGIAALGRSLPPILAFVVGFVDTAVFVHMGGLFVAHVTGNVVLLGATAAGASIGGAHGSVVALQLATFPIFVLAATAAAMIASRSGPRALGHLLWSGAALLAVAAAIAALAPGNDAAVSLVTVAAMGLMNAAHRLEPAFGPPFTVMTGNVTGLSVALAQALRLAPALPPSKNVGGLWALLIGFALGAALGALLVGRLGLACLAAPTLLLVARLVLPIRRKPQ